MEDCSIKRRRGIEAIKSKDTSKDTPMFFDVVHKSFIPPDASTNTDLFSKSRSKIGDAIACSALVTVHQSWAPLIHPRPQSL